MGWSDNAGLGSGLPDRMVFTVASVKIDHPYEKNPTQAAVVLDGEAKVDDEISDEHLWLKPGQQFESGDSDGTFLVHQTQTPAVYDDPASKKKKINKNSAYGKFLASAIAVAGMDALAANQDPARAKYEIWDVKFWEGMVLDVEMVDEPFDFKNDAGEQVTGSSRQPYVRQILGTGAAATPASSPTATPAASANGAGDFTAHESYISFLEAHVGAGGAPGDEKSLAAKAHFEKLKA